MAVPPALRDSLISANQDHVLSQINTLNDAKLSLLIEQLEKLDLGDMQRLIDTYVKSAPTFDVPANTKPAPYYPADPASPVRAYDAEHFRKAGEELLRQGKVACFTVAGGQGSRLGFDGPKGCYPAGAVTGKPLFQVFAEGIKATSNKYGAPVPWLIMTSPQNHEATVVFFDEHNHFGLDPNDVLFFPQGTMPSFDLKTGRILMTDGHTLAASPDGHGGSLKALYTSGAIAKMKERGIEHISYFQVDNPLVRVADPLFLGLHAIAGDSTGAMSSKMLPKAYAEEKVGLFVQVGDRIQVVEYSDMPMDRQRETNDDGSLRFLAGNPAIHAFGVDFVEKVNTDPNFDLPYHRAVKKIAHINTDTGEPISPAEPNGVKLERFVFDALPFAEKSVILETSRVQEFAPIKNAEGIDSAESSAKLQTERAALWLEEAGVTVPRNADGDPDCVLEISALTALDAQDLKGNDLPSAIEPGQKLAL
ncbi:MAG: UDPGP type 1 family protein [Phycisphaera sp.]|nr:MAG: UDPGP type 1 family protein [Phycisphaera sp.]